MRIGCSAVICSDIPYSDSSCPLVTLDAQITLLTALIEFLKATGHSTPRVIHLSKAFLTDSVQALHSFVVGGHKISDHAEDPPMPSSRDRTFECPLMVAPLTQRLHSAQKQSCMLGHDPPSLWLRLDSSDYGCSHPHRGDQ